MKKKIIIGIIAAVVIIIGGVIVIPSIVATGEDSPLERLGDLIDASRKTEDSSEEESPTEIPEEAVASINGQFIYQEDVDYEKAYSALYSDAETTTEEAIKSAAIKRIVLTEADKLGFTFSDAEIDEVRVQTNEDYENDLDINNTYVEQLGVSKDDLIDIYVEVYVYGMAKAKYSAYIFEALLSGDIISNNQDINELINKINVTAIEGYEGFTEDVLKITELYLEDLLSASDFEILETIE